MRKVFAVLTLFLLAALVEGAGNPNSDGYYPSGDYYYWPTANADGSTKWVAYSRKKEYSSYYSNGYYYPTYKWVYYQAYEAPAYPVGNTQVAALPKADDPLWMDKIVVIAGKQAEDQAKLRYRAAEHAAHYASLKLIGAEGMFKNIGYGNPLFTPDSPGGYGAYGSVLLGPHGAMGNTTYGFTDTKTEIFGNQVDRNVLYQQFSRAVQNAQQLAGQGTTDMADLIRQESSAAGAINETLAKLAVFKEQLASLKPEPRTVIREFNFQPQPKVTYQQTTQGPPAGVARLSANDFMVLARNACGACHNAQVKKGGFDIEDYPTMSMEAKSSLWNRRLLTTDPDMLMPKDGRGVGRRLPDQVLQQFLLH